MQAMDRYGLIFLRRLFLRMLEGDGRLSDGTRRTDEAAVSKVLHGEVNIAILNLA